ncbi:uncharacterized protein LOC121878859 isoform X3 [Homarus americanus]|uniref:uncharacterized protein LOC121878859 isoform X3 n=1 Tax=Homarus americanus TaxID=6706 RepID=UPI001C48C0DE|nr:uncharacterized protein LOC121878859 isoform X3 [Homarus americanus]
MGLTRRWGIVVSLAIVTLFAYCHASDTPNYNCYNFIRNGKAAERSNDKSVSRQHRKRGASGCDGPHCAAIEPRGDIVIEVDSYYEAVCLFNPQHINKQDVRFKHVENSPEKSYQIQPVEVSDSAIRINVSHSEAVEYKLQCLRNDSFLCERTVKVGYMPQDVENFTCISKNWQTLNCTWTIPYNPVQVIYNLTYVVVGLHNSRKCPTTDKQLSSCFWEKENFDTRDKWVMTFKARNNLTRHQVEYNHTVHVFETVIPDPPKDMVANVIGPHVVNITWMLPFPIDVFYDGGVIQQVSYRERRVGDQHENAPWQEVDQWRVVPNRFKKEIFSKNITNLRPYTLYDFRVRLHTGTGAIREHMWSDEEIRTERTIATRPTRAPKTDIGTFEVENTIQYREIFINWQRVDPMYWNGPSFRYDVTVFDNEDGRLVTLRPENIEIEDAFAKFTSMNKSTAYRFVIRPVNDVGQAAEDIKAEVVVPEMSDIIEPLTFFRVTAINGSVNTIYMTRWSLPADEKVNQMIKSLTLYWCKKDKYEHRCKNKLEWVNIEDTSITAKNVTYLDSSIYMFGISANSLNSSSGIKWVNCIASYDNPPPPLTNFKAVYVTSTEVKLKWSIDCKAIPTGFNISYCNVTGNEISCPPNADVTYEILNDETLVEHIVRNLHPYTYYIFNIAVLADSGLGKWSKSEKNQTKPYKPSGPPQDLEVKARGQEWVLLAWKPPLVEQRNGRMSQYKIIGEPHLRSIVVQALHNSDIIEFNVTDLTSYTNYTFQVIPCTEGDKDNFCGDLSASLEVQTRIGAPGKISSIDQDDNLLKWDHDECFAPECSFQLLYRVNGTNHVYNTSAGQTAVNFKDLNISCTDRQKEIYIGMRAISKNEDGLILTGPMKDERINCPVPGSNCNDHVPSISVQPQIILVQSPTINQYNTIFNLITDPYRSGHQSPLQNTYILGRNPSLNHGLKKVNLQTNEQVALGIVQLNVGSLHHKGYGGKTASWDSFVSPLEVQREETEEMERGSFQFGCPLIELLRAKEVEIQLKSSNNKFELNIKGGGGSYGLAESIYLHSLVNNGVSGKTESEPSRTSSQIGVDTNNFFHMDTKVTMDYDNDVHDQHTHLEMKEDSAIEVKQDEIVANISSSSIIPTTLDLITTPGGNTTPVSGDYASHPSLTEIESEMLTASVLEETQELVTNSSSEVSLEAMQPGNTVDHVVLLHDGTQKNTESEEVVEGSGVLTGSHSRRSAETPPLAVRRDSADSPLSVVDLLHPGRFISETFNNKELDVSYNYRKQAEVVNYHIREALLANDNVKTIKKKATLEEPQMEYSSVLNRDSEELQSFQHGASMIYNLGLMGSFNGNVGNIVPRFTRGLTAPLNNVLPGEMEDFSVPNNNIVDRGLLPIMTHGREPMRENQYENTNTVSNQKNRHTPHRNNMISDCPFEDIIESHDVKIHLNTLEDGGFELNLQGNGGLYDLMKKFILKANFLKDNMKGKSREEEGLFMSHLRQGNIESTKHDVLQQVQGHSYSDRQLNQNINGNMQVTNTASVDTDSLNKSQVVQSQGNTTNSLDGVDYTVTSEYLNASIKQQTEQSWTEAPTQTSASYDVPEEQMVGPENMIQTQTLSSESTTKRWEDNQPRSEGEQDKIILNHGVNSSVSSDTSEGVDLMNNKSFHSGNWTNNSTQSQNLEDNYTTNSANQTSTPENTKTQMSSSSPLWIGAGVAFIHSTFPQNVEDSTTTPSIHSENTTGNH